MNNTSIGFYKHRSWLPRLVLLGSSIGQISCLPQEKVLPSLSREAFKANQEEFHYDGFSGVTKVETAGPTKLKVSWGPSTDLQVTSYNIYDASNFISPRILKTVRAPTVSYTLTGLTPQTVYAIRVRAADNWNKEDTNQKDFLAITYGGASSAAATSGSTALLIFNDAGNADEVKIYCKTDLVPDFSLTKTVTDVTQTSVELTGLLSGIHYTCRAAIRMGEIEDNNPGTVSFTPIGSAKQIVFGVEPGSAIAGAPLGPQPVIKILDENQNLISAGPDSNATITLSISSDSPSEGTLRGVTSVQAVKGIADFSGKGLLFQEAGDKILTAKKSNTSTQPQGSESFVADSKSFTISPDSVAPQLSKIYFSPDGKSGMVADGNQSYMVGITLSDSFGNRIAGVKPVFISSDPVDTLSQPTKVTDLTGMTTGSIRSTVAGIKTLSLSSPSGMNGVANTVLFYPGVATKVAFSQQPANTPAGPGAMTDLKVSIQDSKGNLISTGSVASAAIQVSIFTNPGNGTLLGTTTVNAVGGVAIFSGLGIDKTGTGYKLVASSSQLAVAYSNTFNVTPGFATKLGITGPTSVQSGACSAIYSVILQDWSGNATNATANTSIHLGGFGSSTLFTSSTCTGTALTKTITFASGSNTRTFYLKDNKGEALVLTATDPAMVMSAGTLDVKILPSQLALSGPTTVIAGKCSKAFTVTTSGNDGKPGNVYANTEVEISGLGGSVGNFYSASDCSGPPLSTTVTLVSGTSTTMIYFSDPKSETLNLSVNDPAGVLATTSPLQTLSVLPSKISMTGPATAVSGKCTSAFKITLKDAADNSVNAPNDTPLEIDGLGETQGAFFSSSLCAGIPLGVDLMISKGSPSITVFFLDYSSEKLTLTIFDPKKTETLLPDPQLDPSPLFALSVSPALLTLEGPPSVKTGVCSAAFIVTTLDGANLQASVLAPLSVELTGADPGGKFYSDDACTTAFNEFTLEVGESQKKFYYYSLNASVNPQLTFTATDKEAVLLSGSMKFMVTPAPAWIGTRASFQWFKSGTMPVQVRINDATGVSAIHLNSTKSNLYIADPNNHRVLKYDYLTEQYIGWIGSFLSGPLPITGSVVSTIISNQCILTTLNGVQTPGWCQGGQSQASGPTMGGMYAPMGIADDGAHLYIVQNNSHSITRYNAVTGAYEGWVGRVWSSAPTGAGTQDLSNTCAITALGDPTPGWCMGGGSTNGAPESGNGTLYYPTAIVYYAPFLYVLKTNAVLRFMAETGEFMGWVGRISDGHPVGLPELSSPSDLANACATGMNNSITPGWCMGGTNTAVGDARTGEIYMQKGLVADAPNDILYVLSSYNNGTITKYQLSTGAFLGHLPNVGGNLVNPQAITWDGQSNFFSNWPAI